MHLFKGFCGYLSKTPLLYSFETDNVFDLRYGKNDGWNISTALNSIPSFQFFCGILRNKPHNS